MALDWKDRLRPATYRGVPFKVESHEAEHGRRASVQEFPQRDDPYVEDLGRKARRYRVQAFVLGDDYMEVRDRLVAVCERRGVGFPHRIGGLLVHPYYGRLRVFPISCRVRETVRQGRMARVSLEFVEAGVAAEPTATVAPKAAAADVAAQIGDASDSFTTAALVTSGPESLRVAISTELDKIGQTLAGLDVFSGPAADVASLAKSVDDLTSDAIALATSPAAAVATIRQAVDTVIRAGGRLDEITFAYKALDDLNSDTISGSGTTGMVADANAAATIAHARVLALGGLGQSLAATEWPSRDEALVARADLVRRIERSLDTPDDLVQSALYRLLLLASQTIPPLGQTLPRIRELTLARTTSSLELAYRLYDNAGRDQEIAERNPSTTRFPGFLPAGVPLQVLSSG